MKAPVRLLCLSMLAIPFHAAEITGSARCAPCHAREARAHGASSMAMTLARGADSPVLRANPNLTFQDGGYRYTIRREGSGSTYSVTDGSETLTVPIAWAFGLGAAGQTYVFERNGRWYESRVSYYREPGGLDLTLGARNRAPRNLDEAAGRPMTTQDAAACFGCHSSGAIRESRLNLENVTPGVQCDNCHTGAPRHAESVRAGNVKAAGIPKLGSLSTDEMSDLCGKCHRTWADIASNGPRGVENVRFQGYRLTNSKCYDPSDRRISCTACHDPHTEVERRVEAYDRKCVACHQQGGAAALKQARAKGCPVRQSGCSGCHMPKFEIPGSHHLFSDHQIRIVRPNEKYPN